MPYKSTGRPVGRPKTKDYTTISLKIEQPLLDRVKTYAKRHGQSVSELIRDGLEWRIGEGDPLAQRYATGESAEQEYYSNTGIPIWTDRESESAGVLAEIRTALAQQAMQLQALTQALEQRSMVSPPSEYYGNTTKVSTGQPSTLAPAPEGNGRHALQEVHAENSNTVLQEDGHAVARNTAAPQPDLPDKATLVARLHQMRTSGLSLSQIAGQLQAEGLPTLSGKGQWQKGTVDKLLHQQVRAIE
jgi:Family of unknown function (DUF6364)/Recombinase